MDKIARERRRCVHAMYFKLFGKQWNDHNILIVPNFDLATGRKTKDKQGRTKFDRCEDIYLCEYSSSQPELVSET